MYSNFDGKSATDPGFGALNYVTGLHGNASCGLSCILVWNMKCQITVSEVTQGVVAN